MQMKQTLIFLCLDCAGEAAQQLAGSWGVINGSSRLIETQFEYEIFHSIKEK